MRYKCSKNRLVCEDMTVFKNRKLMKTRNILIAILALAVANTYTEGWLNIAGIALLSASLVPVAIKMDKADR